MSMFAEYGLKRESGISVPLVDEYKKPLPFLNSSSKRLTNFKYDELAFVPTKLQSNWDVAIPIKVG